MNNRGRLVVDVLIALFAAVLVLILAPGLGVVALIVVIVLIVCGMSHGVDAAVRRRRERAIRAIRAIRKDPRGAGREPRTPRR